MEILWLTSLWRKYLHLIKYTKVVGKVRKKDNIIMMLQEMETNTDNI